VNVREGSEGGTGVDLGEKELSGARASGSYGEWGKGIAPPSSRIPWREHYESEDTQFMNAIFVIPYYYTFIHPVTAPPSSIHPLIFLINGSINTEPSASFCLFFR